MHVKHSIICETQKLSKAKQFRVFGGSESFWRITGNEFGEVGG